MILILLARFVERFSRMHRVLRHQHSIKILHSGLGRRQIRDSKRTGRFLIRDVPACVESYCQTTIRTHHTSLARDATCPFPQTNHPRMQRTTPRASSQTSQTRTRNNSTCIFRVYSGVHSRHTIRRGALVHNLSRSRLYCQAKSVLGDICHFAGFCYRSVRDVGRQGFHAAI